MKIYVCDHCGKATDNACTYGEPISNGIKLHDLCPDCYEKLIEMERRRQKQWDKFVEKYLNAAGNPKQIDTDDFVAEYIRKNGVK